MVTVSLWRSESCSNLPLLPWTHTQLYSGTVFYVIYLIISIVLVFCASTEFYYRWQIRSLTAIKLWFEMVRTNPCPPKQMVNKLWGQCMRVYHVTRPYIYTHRGRYSPFRKCTNHPSHVLNGGLCYLFVTCELSTKFRIRLFFLNESMFIGLPH